MLYVSANQKAVSLNLHRYSTDFDFAANFSKAYLKASCKQWYNLGVPHRLIYGGATFDGNTMMTDMGAMRTVLATFDETRLSKVGLRYTDWVESGSAGEAVDLLNCPASGPTLDDCSCTEDFQITSALKYTCVPSDVPQTPQCCSEFMKPVAEHKCGPHLFSAKAGRCKLKVRRVYAVCTVSTLSAQCRRRRHCV